MNNRITLLIATIVMTLSCNNETNLYPLSEGSADKWFSSEVEIKMALMDLYKPEFFTRTDNYSSDDLSYREVLTPIVGASLNGQSSTVTTMWTNSYKAVSRANKVLESLEKESVVSSVPPVSLDAYKAEALFIRAYQYGSLVNHFGDVVYTEHTLSIDEALAVSRTSKDIILESVYRDLDIAAEGLPVAYSKTETSRATKGMAYAYKARIAIRNSDFDVAAEAAKKCMDLDAYTLHVSFSDLFLPSTKKSAEGVHIIPRSVEFKSVLYTSNILPRLHGGWGAEIVSWDLASAFLCTDGLPIDESPNYDPVNPFANRDPRMSATIIPIGKDVVTTFLGIDYDPNPYSEKVMNHNTGKMVKNNDCKFGSAYASYTGMLSCKGVDETYKLNGYKAEPDGIYLRYADVLLMYAESKIELNQIDQSVLDAINMVRARAYGVSIDQTASYPAVTTTDQSSLRTVIRFERRMEFAGENLRYYDLIRWKLAEKALSLPRYGLLDIDPLKALIDRGLWFFPGVPEIDKDGIADFSALSTAGNTKVIAYKKFDVRQYLWPIPSKEILVNENLKPNNPGY